MKYKILNQRYIGLIPTVLSTLWFTRTIQGTQAIHCDKQDHCTTSSTSTISKMTNKELSKENALWGMLISDATSMPVHWYYNPSSIKSGYGGWLTGYRAANKKHPQSILTLSAVDGSGRTGWHSKSKRIVGDVILHDKLKYWTSGDRSTHYHQGMQAGENTLNSVVALRVFSLLQKQDPDRNMDTRELRKAVLEDYVKFMTTPGSHNDTYAESFHRLFFKDWIMEDDPPKSGENLITWAEARYQRKCLEGEDSQISSIGGLVIAIPWVLHYSNEDVETCVEATLEFLKLTHPNPSMQGYVELYARLLHGAINGNDLKTAALQTASDKMLGGARKRDLILKLTEAAKGYMKDSESRLQVYQSATSTLGSACYIEGAMSSMLFLAQACHDDFEDGILMNANCGGENCHRGAALGALLGAASTHQNKVIPARWKDGLVAGATVEKLFSGKSAL
ncbi:unnamed protein product [Owenia fusiformis]|uniref:ADP-ribosylglycohydrolase n=1 Tax=Owenia fusiformis TaxID=6347 RepID=A0A8S4NPB0_OWEFU|nr:unnamed protein product [Owenia fusiformis]